MAKDYSCLEGTHFTYHTGTKEKKAKVLYADYEIGLTCVNEDKLANYVICLQGPSSPAPMPVSRKQYQYIWAWFIRRIQYGYVDGIEAKNLMTRHGRPQPGVRGLSSKSCAFGK